MTTWTPGNGSNFVAFNSGRIAIAAIYHGIYIYITVIYHGIYHTNRYIPWYILLVGNLDLLLPHGIYHCIYQVFGIYLGIYRSQGVLYHGIYKFDLILPHCIHQFGW
jgi:hypothetical protein